MPQLNIYYGDNDEELMSHLQQLKSSGVPISTWVKEACLMRLRAETTDTTQSKLDLILSKLESIEAGGVAVRSNGDGDPSGDQDEIGDFFESAMESFG